MSPIAPRLLEHKHIAVKRCRHGVFAYNVNDLAIGRSLDEYGEWSEVELRLLFQILQPGDVVVDVGANIGTHTVAFANHVTPAGVVFAFEPQRLTYQLLCANVALNGLVNVQCIQAAAGDTPGMTRVLVLDPTVPYNMGLTKAEGGGDGEPVPVTRIDDLRLGRCNVIKIDVEGMESRVLDGATHTILTLRPVLYVENNVEAKSADVLARLDNLGYACWWHIAPNHEPDNFFGTEKPLFPRYFEANVLGFPKEAAVTIEGTALMPVEPGDTYERALRRAVPDIRAD